MQNISLCNLYLVFVRYISTLYSHPNFPRISPSEMLDELRKNVRHSPFWLLSPRSMYRYISSIKAKYKNGQPVSFTDFFGHLLGDTLLKDVSIINFVVIHFFLRFMV